MNRWVRRAAAWALVGASVLAVACAEQRAEVLEPWPELEVTAQVDPRKPAAHPIVGEGDRRHGAAVRVVRMGEARRVVVADADAKALRVLDVATDEEVATVALDAVPSQLVPAADGRLWVSLRHVDRVVAVELVDPATGELAITRQLTVPIDPVGLAATPEGQLLVVSAWEAQLVAFELATEKPILRVGLAREPRSVAVLHGEAYVTHASASQITRVPLDTGAAAEVPLGGQDLQVEHGIASSLAMLEIDTIGFLGSTGSGDLAVTSPFGMRATGVGVAPSVPAQAQPAEGRGKVDFRGGDLADPFSDGFDDTTAIPVPRDWAQGFALALSDERIFAPGVLVHRGRAQTGGYGTSEAFPAHQAALAQIEEGEAKLRVFNRAFAVEDRRAGFAGGLRRRSCKLPRAAAARGDVVFVSCLGTDEVLAYEAKAESLASSLRARWEVPAGPTGITFDEVTQEVIVWSQFEQTLSRLRLPEAEPERAAGTPSKKRSRLFEAQDPVRVATLPAVGPRDAKWRGRALFHGSGDRRISGDGRACASCHPDGRDDGLTWPTPNGPRQTPMLAGRLMESTKPYGWQGDTATVEAHVRQTFRRLGGRGLDDDAMADLMTYLRGMDEPVRPAPTPSADEVAKGRALFHSETVGCAVCHTEEGVGSDGARHDVGTGASVETPSLRFVAGTGPYFHDGRYATLSQLLRETKGTMGWAADMPAADLAALEAYLLTL